MCEHEWENYWHHEADPMESGTLVMDPGHHCTFCVKCSEPKDCTWEETPHV